jgi:RimJ/RimL family protein N-acetyltransferase
MIGIFQPLDRPEPELAHLLDRPFWGQGFATEAATEARGWLFRHFRLARPDEIIR